MGFLAAVVGMGFFCIAVLGTGFLAPWTTFVAVGEALTGVFFAGVVTGVFFAVDVTGVFFVPMGWATMFSTCDGFAVVRVSKYVVN
jgi:hypothetical protein